MTPLETEAVALTASGAWDKAEVLWRRAVALSPDNDRAWCGLGDTLLYRGRHGDALAAFDRAVAARPGSAPARLGRASALHGLRRHDEALDEINLLLSRENLPAAHCLAGQVLFANCRLEESLTAFQRALADRPDMLEALLGSAAVLRCLNRQQEARDCADRVVALAPDLALGHLQHGWIAYAMDDRETALADFATAVRLNPDLFQAVLMQVELKSHLCRWDDDRERLLDAVRRSLDTLEIFDPYVILAFCDDADLIKRVAMRVAAPLQPTPRRGKTPERLRIMLLSPDFRDHAVGWQIAELIERLDKTRFEIAGICTRRLPTAPDPMRDRLRKSFAFFGETVGLSSQQIAERLAAAGTAIAVDMALCTEGGRPEILSWRPAAVTAQWLGYPGTSGAAFIDYVIADAVVIPPEAEHFYTEKIVRLPGSFMPLDTTIAPAPTPPRRDLGLPEDAVVFSAFNRAAKITPEMFARWLRIVADVPGSVLWLNVTGPAQDNLRNAAAAAGVDPARLVFSERLGSRDGHLGRLAAADLYLDCHPYGGHATAADHLWAGVPVVTAPGQSFASRVGASMLTAAGMPELIAADEAGYHALAVGLANDKARRESLRARLIAGRRTAPLFDMTAMARAMENAFLAMWEGRGKPPQNITI